MEKDGCEDGSSTSTGWGTEDHSGVSIRSDHLPDSLAKSGRADHIPKRPSSREDRDRREQNPRRVGAVPGVLYQPRDLAKEEAREQP